MQNKVFNKSLPRIGILGGGQLSVMMTEAYQALGGSVIVYCDGADDPATALANEYFIGARDDLASMESFFAKADVVTLENEFFDARLLSEVSAISQTPVLPDPEQYQRIEDKYSENRFFQELGIRVADFFVVNDEADLQDTPGFLKISKGGYDGIGTQHVANLDQARDCFRSMSKQGIVIFEEEIICAKELSLIAAANTSDLVFYPLVETCQESGTCRYVMYPAGVSDEIEQEARDIVGKIMTELGTSGLFAFEFFFATDGSLILNESAPRPHNSGHITLDTMDCSQFENHMRAIAGLDLRLPTATKESALMVNLLATREGEFDHKQVLSGIDDNDTSVNLYGKKQLRKNRKMGHINLWGPELRQRADALLNSIDI